MNIADESEGTRNIFGISPLFKRAFEKTGEVICIDEFDKSLHPSLVQYLIKPHICVIIADYKAPLPGVMNSGYERRKREVQDLILSYDQTLSVEEGDELRERLFVDPKDKFQSLCDLPLHVPVCLRL